MVFGTRVIFLLSVFVGASCQTTKPPSFEELPFASRALFIDCGNADGQLALRLRNEGRWFGPLDMEWIAGDKGEWTTEFAGFMGEPLLRVRYVDGLKNLSTRGRWQQQLPQMSVEKQQGFLLVDSHFTPVKLPELPCFFKGKLPRAWFSSLSRFTEDKDAWHYVFDQDKRRMRLRQDKHSSEFCLEFSWRTHWRLIGHHVSYCRRDHEDFPMQLEYKDFLLAWKVQP